MCQFFLKSLSGFTVTCLIPGKVVEVVQSFSHVEYKNVTGYCHSAVKTVLGSLIVHSCLHQTFATDHMLCANYKIFMLCSRWLNLQLQWAAV